MLFHSYLVKSYSCRGLCLAIPLLLVTTPMAARAQPYVITDSAYPNRTATGGALFSNAFGSYNTARGYLALTQTIL